MGLSSLVFSAEKDVDCDALAQALKESAVDESDYQKVGSLLRLAIEKKSACEGHADFNDGVAAAQGAVNRTILVSIPAPIPAPIPDPSFVDLCLESYSCIGLTSLGTGMGLTFFFGGKAVSVLIPVAAAVGVGTIAVTPALVLFVAGVAVTSLVTAKVMNTMGTGPVLHRMRHLKVVHSPVRPRAVSPIPETPARQILHMARGASEGAARVVVKVLGVAQDAAELTADMVARVHKYASSGKGFNKGECVAWDKAGRRYVISEESYDALTRFPGVTQGSPSAAKK